MDTAGPVSSKEKTYERLLADNCPAVDIVGELSSLSEFTNPQNPIEKNMISRVQISESSSLCEYTTKSVTVDLKLTFDGILGQQGRINSNDKPFFTYPFFIAVVSPSGKILAKEIFAASMTYDQGKDHQLYYESLRQIIPVKGKRNGARHKIMVGFQLSPEQLAYNRALLNQVQTIQMPDSESKTAPAPDTKAMDDGHAPMSLTPDHS